MIHIHCFNCNLVVFLPNAIEVVFTRPYTLETIEIGMSCHTCLERVVFPSISLARCAHLN